MGSIEGRSRWWRVGPQPRTGKCSAGVETWVQRRSQTERHVVGAQPLKQGAVPTTVTRPRSGEAPAPARSVLEEPAASPGEVRASAAVLLRQQPPLRRLPLPRRTSRCLCLINMRLRTVLQACTTQAKRRGWARAAVAWDGPRRTSCAPMSRSFLKVGCHSRGQGIT